MTYDELRVYCLAKAGASEGFPFGDDTAVLKVMSKMFALMPVGAAPARMNLKCDPNWALVLRATYTAITPGYHMNKAHWNTVIVDGSVPADLVYEMIDHSYKLVAQSLPRAEREKLGAL
ncbi:MAG: MmcQ/YjbR family DNA-binding protein [Chloroflexi bacterium]|nr:MmcQ/YjbR family DNA-binding protein [Chloroflexota bacterium]